MDLAEGIGIVSSVLAIVFMLSGIPTCMQIRRNKSTHNVASAPFLAGLFNSILWLNYGLLIGNPVIYVVTLIGAVLNVLYLAVFYIYCPNKNTFFKSVVAVTASTTIFTAYTLLIAEAALGEWLAGLVACVAAVGFVAAPLAELGTVMKTRSTEIIPIPMVVGNTTLSLLNLWYAVLINDTFMMIPNIIGSVVSIFTVSLFFIYPSKPSTKKE